PAATTYSANATIVFEASGAGSKLDLTKLTSLRGTSSYYAYYLGVEAKNGGTIDLSNVTNNPAGAIHVLADGTSSVVDLSKLTRFQGASIYSHSSLEVRASGTILVGKVTSMENVEVTVNATGTLATRQITTFVTGSVIADGTAADLSSMTDIHGSTITLRHG